MVALDSTILLLFLFDKVAVPNDPDTGKPFERGKDRVENLIDNLSSNNTPILVPTPVLAEILVRAGPATPQYLSKVRSVPGIQIGDFDQRAAVELAMMTGAALTRGSKKSGMQVPWQKVKFDRQIVAIAKANGASRIYSCDENLQTLARLENIQAPSLRELSLPPEKDQKELLLGWPDDR